MERIWCPVGDYNFWLYNENPQTKRTTKMGCCIIFNNGLGGCLYSAKDDRNRVGARNVVCSGGRIVLFAGGYFLSASQVEIFPYDLAFVRYWRQRLLFSLRCCSAVLLIFNLKIGRKSRPVFLLKLFDFSEKMS